MAAYRIDTDFTITRVEGDGAQMKARGWEWSCID
jgi:hypothetical protein